MKSLIKIFSLLTLVAILAISCTTLIVGGVVTGLSVFTDPRSTSAQIEDKNIYLQSQQKIYSKFRNKVDVSVTSYDREVLLTGFVPSEQIHQELIELIRSIDNVQEVYDELKVDNSVSNWRKTKDVTLTGQIRANLIKARHLSSNYFKVTCNNATAYVMGVSSAKQKDLALETISKVRGVKNVVSYIKTADI